MSYQIPQPHTSRDGTDPQAVNRAYSKFTYGPTTKPEKSSPVSAVQRAAAIQAAASQFSTQLDSFSTVRRVSSKLI